MSSAPATVVATNGGAPAHILGWRDYLALWFGLGAGLLVIESGVFAAQAGLRNALIATVIGSVVGAGLVGWLSQIGFRTGLTSDGLMRAVYGRRVAAVPMALNVVQLVGWTTFELVILRDSTRDLLGQSFGAHLGIVWPTVVWGLVVLILMRASMVAMVQRIIGRVVLPLTVIALVWVTVKLGIGMYTGATHIPEQALGGGGMSLLQATDLVVAFPVSWFPCVADFSRHSRSGRGALAGTWVGYAIANIWCYALGVILFAAHPAADTSGALVLAEAGLAALGLLMLGELDNAYGGLYAGAESAHALSPRSTFKNWGTILSIACIVLGVVLPMRAMEPFLLILSAVFVPLFGTIFAYALAGRRRLAEPFRSAATVPTAIWILGMACYYLMQHFAPAVGSTLPTLALTFMLGLVAARRDAGRERA